MRRFLFDTSVFVYALGGEHPYREPCRAILGALERKHVSGEASTELIHEFAYVRRRRTHSRADVTLQAKRIRRSCPLHVVTPRDIDRALDLGCEHERLDMRDAIFAAQALNRDIDAILSPDEGFDGISGLQRIDPADAKAVAALTAR